MGKSLISDSARAWTGVGLNPNSEFGIVLVLVVVLVLGALGFRDRKETDVLQLICSVSLIAKRSGFSRTRTTTTRSLEGSRFVTCPITIRRWDSGSGLRWCW